MSPGLEDQRDFYPRSQTGHSVPQGRPASPRVSPESGTDSVLSTHNPNSGGIEADIAAQTAMMFELRKDINNAVATVNRTELVRGQLDALARILDDAAIKKAGEELNRKLMDLEMDLIDLRLTGGQDGTRYGSKLVSKLGYLSDGQAPARLMVVRVDPLALIH